MLSPSNWISTTYAQILGLEPSFIGCQAVSDGGGLIYTGNSLAEKIYSIYAVLDSVRIRFQYHSGIIGMIHPIPDMAPVLDQPLPLRDNLLTPDFHARRGSQGRIARPEASRGIEESLKGVTHLFIKQSVITSEFFVNAANKYEILNSGGERIFLVAETTDLFTRLCYGGFQPFHLTVYNSRPVVSIGATREKSNKFLEVLKFSGIPGVCTSVGHITVTDGTKPLGNIQQIQKYGAPLYSVRTPLGAEILQIAGPNMGRCCFNIRPFIGSLEFEIIDPKDESMIGRIVKQWGGFAREFFTKADIWGIKFPPDMDTATKSLLLASVFLIDFQYFER